MESGAHLASRINHVGYYAMNLYTLPGIPELNAVGFGELRCQSGRFTFAPVKKVPITRVQVEIVAIRAHVVPGPGNILAISGNGDEHHLFTQSFFFNPGLQLPYQVHMQRAGVGTARVEKIEHDGFAV